jgi:hypothetical protein
MLTKSPPKYRGRKRKRVRTLQPDHTSSPFWKIGITHATYRDRLWSRCYATAILLGFSLSANGASTASGGWHNQSVCRSHSGKWRSCERYPPIGCKAEGHATTPSVCSKSRERTSCITVAGSGGTVFPPIRIYEICLRKLESMLVSTCRWTWARRGNHRPRTGK